MGMLIIGAVVGLIVIASLDFIIGLLEKILGKRNTNLLLGLLFLYSAILTSSVLIDTISYGLYIYNSIDTSSIIFYSIFGFITLSSLYSSYNLLINDESLDGVGLFVVSLFGVYISFILLHGVKSEIKPSEYKHLSKIYEIVKSNPKTKKLYNTVFSEITKDNIVTVKEYRKLTKIEKYYNYLNQEIMNNKKIINETYQKQQYLQEVKQKYLIENSTEE